MVLALIVALIYLTLNVGARRLLNLNPSAQALVKVVERVPVDAKRTLFVLEAGGEYLLVGSTEQSMSLLSKLPQEAVEAALKQRQARRQAAPGTFLAKLQALGAQAPSKDPGPTPPPTEPPTGKTE